jgi:hypothetical protein
MGQQQPQQQPAQPPPNQTCGVGGAHAAHQAAGRACVVDHACVATCKAQRAAGSACMHAGRCTPQVTPPILAWLQLDDCTWRGTAPACQPRAAGQLAATAGRPAQQQRRAAACAASASTTHYSVSGGPMMVTAHSKMLESSTSPAEKPSTGCLVSSAATQGDAAAQPRSQHVAAAACRPGQASCMHGRQSPMLLTSQLLLQQACGIVCHGCSPCPTRTAPPLDAAWLFTAPKRACGCCWPPSRVVRRHQLRPGR